ncbi:hypothetical protein ABIF90_004884 [Bradyrhizobium japonicum]
MVVELQPLTALHFFERLNKTAVDAINGRCKLKGRRQAKQRQWTVGLDLQESLHQRSEIVRRQPEVADEDFRKAFFVYAEV